MAPIIGVTTSITAFLGRTARGPVDSPHLIHSFSEYEQIYGGLSLDSSISYAVKDYFANGGRYAVIERLCRPTQEKLIPEEPIGPGDPLEDEDYQKGLENLDQVDLINLVCIPPDLRAGTTSKSVYQAALATCVQRRAMLLVDPPPDWGRNLEGFLSQPLEKVEEDLGLTGREARNAALYFPHALLPDPLQGDRLELFPPSGMVAGLIARTDEQRGVWKAPAGTEATLFEVVGLQVELDDHQNGILNHMGINCLRSFPSVSPVVWGSRTLRGANHFADEYKYVPLRRLALFIEESIDRGTGWAVFELNTEPAWAQIRMEVNAFLHDLFLLGAFVGRTPPEAYFIKCGEDTMTQDDIDNGNLIVEIGIAPVKPAEFVIIRIQKRVGQESTSS